MRSLSGGETFQASLAFALALSDHLASLAAGGAARLDAIFLDEGFGTLDADSLDTVAATIEALAGGGRMVGIVTHVRELAERMPVRYVVTKGPGRPPWPGWWRDAGRRRPLGPVLRRGRRDRRPRRADRRRQPGRRGGPGAWSPRRPAVTAEVDVVVFVDGVRRVDARVWVGDEAGRRGRRSVRVVGGRRRAVQPAGSPR